MGRPGMVAVSPDRIATDDAYGRSVSALSLEMTPQPWGMATVPSCDWTRFNVRPTRELQAAAPREQTRTTCTAVDWAVLSVQSPNNKPNTIATNMPKAIWTSF